MIWSPRHKCPCQCWLWGIRHLVIPWARANRAPKRSDRKVRDGGENHLHASAFRSKQSKTGGFWRGRVGRYRLDSLMGGKESGAWPLISCHLCNSPRGRRCACSSSRLIGVAWRRLASMFNPEVKAGIRLSSSIVGMGQGMLSFSENPDPLLILTGGQT